MSNSKIKEIDKLIYDHQESIEKLRVEKRGVEDKLLLPKVINKYLGKYFLKHDYFNKKETMLIHIREIINSNEYVGEKIQFHPNESFSINTNYLGHIGSVGKEVGQEVWKKEVDKVKLLIQFSL
jgi:hypothetical protein